MIMKPPCIIWKMGMLHLLTDCKENDLLHQLYRLITSSIPEPDCCNTLSYLTTHRHRIPTSSQQ